MARRLATEICLGSDLCVCVCVCVCVYMHACMHACMHTCIHTHAYVRTYIHSYTDTHIHTLMHTYATYVYMNTHKIHTHSRNGPDCSLGWGHGEQGGLGLDRKSVV